MRSSDSSSGSSSLGRSSTLLPSPASFSSALVPPPKNLDRLGFLAIDGGLALRCARTPRGDLTSAAGGPLTGVEAGAPNRPGPWPAGATASLALSLVIQFIKRPFIWLFEAVSGLAASDASAVAAFLGRTALTPEPCGDFLAETSWPVARKVLTVVRRILSPPLPLGFFTDTTAAAAPPASSRGRFLSPARSGGLAEPASGWS
mmetsp:Transcript_11310/g.26451  ORF Transcript_11310/g.26451 Transcript_11310/m.26451 type:complete len:203 (-) Transcript_11310:808-1416(-)